MCDEIDWSLGKAVAFLRRLKWPLVMSDTLKHLNNPLSVKPGRCLCTVKHYTVCIQLVININTSYTL